jgi:hypothetical protein
MACGGRERLWPDAAQPSPTGEGVTKRQPALFCCLSGVFFQPVQHHVVVIAGFEVIKHVFNFAVSVDQEADAVNTVVGFPHKRFLAPDAKLLAYLMIFIRQQREVQQLFFGKRESFSGLSVLIPSTSTPTFFNSSMLSRKPQACTVQPGSWLSGRNRPEHAVPGSRSNLLARRLDPVS